MEGMLWILLPGFAAIASGLLAWFVMQSRMDVALAEQRAFLTARVFRAREAGVDVVVQILDSLVRGIAEIALEAQRRNADSTKQIPVRVA